MDNISDSLSGPLLLNEDYIEECSDDSDDPHTKGVPLREQDRFLPIANIAKIMKRAIPENGKVSLTCGFGKFFHSAQFLSATGFDMLIFFLLRRLPKMPANAYRNACRSLYRSSRQRPAKGVITKSGKLLTARIFCTQCAH